MIRGFLSGLFWGGIVASIALFVVLFLFESDWQSPFGVQTEAKSTPDTSTPSEIVAEVTMPTENIETTTIPEDAGQITAPANLEAQAASEFSEPATAPEEVNPAAENSERVADARVTDAPSVAETVAPAPPNSPVPAESSKPVVPSPEISGPSVAEALETPDNSDALQTVPTVTDTPQVPEGDPPVTSDSAEEVVPEPEPTDPAAVESEGSTDVAQIQPPRISAPVAPITDRATGVTTNRLPTINDDRSNAYDLPEVADPEQPVRASTGDLSLAIERNAVAFSNPEGRPLLSVVLLDQGAARTELGALENLPFPVSFIVQANAPDVTEAIAFYREKGAEVLVQPVLPPDPTPTDAEVNFEAQAAVVSEAVAVYMSDTLGFQGDSALARQISEILVASGHGLVSHPQGLNTGHKTATKTGVPAGLVFRVLDDQAQDANVMRRLLDNAAFKAAREEGVILLGHARPETLKALIEWSLGNRVSSVAVAPVSALLLGG